MNAPVGRAELVAKRLSRFRPASLRVRLALAFAVAVTCALVIFGAVVSLVVWRSELHEVQERATSGKSGEPQKAGSLSKHVDAHDGDDDDDDGDTDDDHDLARVVSAMLVAAPLVIAAAMAFGLWLARRSLQPLKEAAARVQAARASELLLTLPVRGAGDEWDELATTLNQLLSQARGSMARIQRFTADAAHELRTPLTTLIGEADLALLRERSVGELRAALEVVRGESQRMAQLVDALLSLSRADGGTLLAQTNPHTVELQPLLREAALRAEARAKRKARPCTVALTLSDSAPLWVRGEAVLLSRALGNLLDNAVDHGGSNIGLLVNLDSGSRPGPSRICVRVEDDGPGIPESLRPRLFERFARADVSRSSEGFGLGLALSRAIVQAHGGSLELTRASPGARFELWLPRADPAL